MLLHPLELEGSHHWGLLSSTSLSSPSSGSMRTAGTGGWWWSIPIGQCAWPAQQPTASPAARPPCASLPEFPQQEEGKRCLGPGRPQQHHQPSSSPPCSGHCLPQQLFPPIPDIPHIPEKIVSGNAVSRHGAPQGMISHHIILLLAVRAGPFSGEERHT